MASKRATRATSVAFASVLMAMAATASAEPTAAEKETARRLMEEGRERVEKKDSQGALEAFKAADEIMHVPSTGLMVATEQVSLGRLVEARETLQRVIRYPATPGEPEAFQRARKAAEELDESVARRIPSITFDVRGTVGGAAPTVVVDDIAVGAAVVKYPFRLNPGHHVVVAKSSAGTVLARQEIDVAEMETKSVVLELPPDTGPAHATPVQRPAEQPRSGGARALTYIGFGVATVGVVVGSITGILMFSKKSTLDESCTDKRCPPQAQGDLSSAYTFATVSTVSFIVAGVGAGVGVVSLLTGRGSAPAATATSGVHVEPWAGVGSGGLRGSF